MANAINRDDRLIQDARENSNARASREAAEPHEEPRETTDKLRLTERLAMLENVDTVLPTPPKIPGFHTIWLTTTNPQDSLERRYQLGYELVRPEEIPDWDYTHASQKSSGAVSKDRIMINEMVLAKLPEELYLAYLKHNHHTRPLQQEQAITGSAVISTMKDGRGRTIGIIEGEGHAELGKPRKADFSGVMDKVSP